MHHTSFQSAFAGVYTASVTPFTADGSIDFEAFDRLLKRQAEADVDGIVLGGSTGEGSALSIDERFELVARSKALLPASKTIVVGAGHNITSEAVALQKAMEKSGAHFSLHVTPWYNKPTQEGLYRHFRAIAENSPLPIIIYNNPPRTCVDMHPETIARLLKSCSNICALKDSNLETTRVQQLLTLREEHPNFSVVAGEDHLFFPVMALGGQGIIATSSNFAPRLLVDLYKAMASNDLVTARPLAWKLSRLAELMFWRTNPIPAKMALSFLGVIEPNFRLPLCAPSHQESTELKERLTSEGWL
jgi:4-hydroxy-tetrahydrodipicolinate synthase